MATTAELRATTEPTAIDRAQAAGNAASGEPEGSVPPVTVTQPASGVALLTLNRPKSRNALSRDMMAAIEATLQCLAHEQDINAIVIAAEGPAFCAGHDLKELTAHRSAPDGGKAFYAETMRACSSMMMSVVNCPKPVIAAVDAMATAAGCQLVATCDLAVAGGGAKFCTPGVNIGLFCSTPMVALSRNVSRKKAMEMLLLGELIDAVDAEKYGLINKVVPDGKALDGALEFAKVIASKSPLTVAYGKQAFYAQLEKPLPEAYSFASDVMVQNMMASDAQEGIGAFLEKRQPEWKGC